jgi:hypothetical protein
MEQLLSVAVCPQPTDPVMHIRRCAFKRKIAATFNDAPVAATSVVLLRVRTENSSKPRSGHPEPKKPDNGVQLIIDSV